MSAEGCSTLGAPIRIRNRAREEIEFWILEMPTFRPRASEDRLARPWFQYQRYNRLTLQLPSSGWARHS